MLPVEFVLELWATVMIEVRYLPTLAVKGAFQPGIGANDAFALVPIKGVIHG